MPEMRFHIRWPDGTREACYSPSLVIKDHLAVGQDYPLDEFVALSRLALGIASDLMVAHGGTTILSETTEIYGGEHTLTRRAISREVGEKLVERIKWWEWYTKTFNMTIDNNPSVGNKKGGLTTIYEKSLGAIAKGGSTALRQVYRYAEPVTAA